MFRSTLLRRMVVALCMALMRGVVSVGQIVAGDDARVRSRFTRTCMPECEERRWRRRPRRSARSATGMRPGGGAISSSAVRRLRLGTRRLVDQESTGFLPSKRRRQAPGRESQPAGRMNNSGEDAK